MELGRFLDAKAVIEPEQRQPLLERAAYAGAPGVATVAGSKLGLRKNLLELILRERLAALFVVFAPSASPGG